MPYRDRGLWRAVVKIEGKRISAGFPTRAEAVAWEVEQKRLARQRTTSGGAGLYELAARYLEHAEREFQPKVTGKKKSTLKRFLAHAGADMALTDITPAIILDYLHAQRRSRTAAACNEDRSHLRAMWYYGRIAFDLDRNPAAMVPPFKADRRQLYTPPEEDVQAVLAAAQGEALVWLRCYLLTGAREQEVNRLRWEHVDFEHGRIGFMSKKIRSVRQELQYIPMASLLSESLKSWRKIGPRGSEWVFPSPRTGNACHQRDRLLRRACERAGVRPFGFHSMRRYVGSILAKSGEPMRTIQAILRHRSLAHTERYIRGLGIDTAGAMGRLESLVEPESTTAGTTVLRIIK